MQPVDFVNCLNSVKFSCSSFSGSVSGLVGSTYHLIAFPPASNLLGLQRATSGTVMMGKHIHVQHHCLMTKYFVMQLMNTSGILPSRPAAAVRVKVITVVP